LSLKKGESVGLVGPVGSGAVALAEAIAGVRLFPAGEVHIDASKVPSGRSDVAVSKGIALVSADRHTGGLLPFMSVEHNLSLAALGRISRRGWISLGAERRLARRFVDALSIRIRGLHQRISELSGGNQQKVMIARALASEPKVLILANPTVGIDVAAKQAIYELMGDLASRGLALIVASEDDLADVRSCNRVFVFGHGRVHVVLGEERSEDDVLAAVEGLTT
jgi:simple sugar transport system ATP-binding protein